MVHPWGGAHREEKGCLHRPPRHADGRKMLSTCRVPTYTCALRLHDLAILPGRHLRRDVQSRHVQSGCGRDERPLAPGPLPASQPDRENVQRVRALPFPAQSSPPITLTHSFWKRLIRTASPVAQQRFKETLDLYFQAAAQQAVDHETSSIPDPDVYMALRRDTRYAPSTQNSTQHSHRSFVSVGLESPGHS